MRVCSAQIGRYGRLKPTSHHFIKKRQKLKSPGREKGGRPGHAHLAWELVKKSALRGGKEGYEFSLAVRMPIFLNPPEPAKISGPQVDWPSKTSSSRRETTDCR